MTKSITITEASERLGVHPDTLKRWESAGHITPRYTDGGHRRYDELEIVMFLQRSSMNKATDLEEFKQVFAGNSPKTSPDDATLQLFSMYLENFTIWHIALLYLFDNPPEWFKKHNKTPPNFGFSSNLVGVLEKAYPELKDKRSFYDQVWKDLFDCGVIGTPNLHGMMTETGWTAPRTTELGKKFLKFIEQMK